MSYSTQNQLLLNKLMEFYKKDNNIDKILPIINGEHKVSLRLIDWFVTNYSKKHYTCYMLADKDKTRSKIIFYNRFRANGLHILESDCIKTFIGSNWQIRYC